MEDYKKITFEILRQMEHLPFSFKDTEEDLPYETLETIPELNQVITNIVNNEKIDESIEILGKLKKTEIVYQLYRALTYMKFITPEQTEKIKQMNIPAKIDSLQETIQIEQTIPSLPEPLDTRVALPSSELNLDHHIYEFPYRQ